MLINNFNLTVAQLTEKVSIRMISEITIIYDEKKSFLKAIFYLSKHLSKQIANQIFSIYKVLN